MTNQTLAPRVDVALEEVQEVNARRDHDREIRRDRLIDQGRLWGIRILVLVTFLSVWEFVSGRFFPIFIVSTPSLVWSRFLSLLEDGVLINHLLYTMQACLTGFGIGAAIGSTLGLLFGIYGSVARIISPFATMLYSTPKIMLAPLIVVWFGVDMTMKVVIAAFSCMWIIFYNVWNATRRIDTNLLDQMRLMGASQRQIIFGLYFPSAATWLLTSLRVAFPIALIGSVVGEFVASDQGLGFLALSSGHRYDTAGVLVAVLTITLTAMTIDSILSAIQRKVALLQGEGEKK